MRPKDHGAGRFNATNGISRCARIWAQISKPHNSETVRPSSVNMDSNRSNFPGESNGVGFQALRSHVRELVCQGRDLDLGLRSFVGIGEKPSQELFGES